MGLEQAQMFATLFDGVTRHSPEGLRSRREAQVQGARLQAPRAVARQQPGGRPIAEDDEARAAR